MKRLLAGLFLLTSHSAWSQPTAGTAVEHAALDSGTLVALAETAPRPCSLPDSTRSTRPLMLTVSGGISLGSYQAGVNWAVLYLLKLAGEKRAGRPDSLGSFHLTAATGASAGNINALFSAAEWARTDFTRRTPESSLFWQMWTEVGLGQLLPELEGQVADSLRAPDYDSGILTRHYFSTVLRDSLFNRLKTGPFDACTDVAIGITMTRLDPVVVDLARGNTTGSEADAVGLHIRTQRAATVYRVRVGDAPGSPLYIEHHDATRTPRAKARTDSTDRYRERGPFIPFGESRRARGAAAGSVAGHSWQPDSVTCFQPGRFGQLALPAFDANTSNTEQNYHLAFRLTLASSSFPVAFGPVDVMHTTGRTSEGWATGYQERPFADGGVFDNNPLSLAYELYDYSQAPNGDPCLPAPHVSRFEPRTGSIQWERPLFVYLDSDDRRPVRAQPEPAPVAAGLQSLWRLAQGLVPTAREHEIEMMTRTMSQDGRNALSITNRLAPVTGDFLGAFGAFLEPSFRHHDFYTGIYDGFYYVASQVICDGPDRGRVGCAEAEMAKLYAWSGLAALSPRANEVYRRSFEREFGRAPAAAPPVAPPVLLSPPLPEGSAYRPLPLDSTQMVVINAVTKALMPEQAGQMVPFVDFIDALRESPAQDSLEAWGSQCSDLRRNSGDPLRVCKAEPYTRNLLRNPESWLYTLAEVALSRAEDIEDASLLFNEIGIELVHAVVAGNRERTTRGFQFSPSSIAERGSFFRQVARLVLPYEVGTQFLSGRGISLTYRPTYRSYRWSRFAATLPITPFQMVSVAEAVSALSGELVETSRTEYRATAGPGATVRFSGMLSVEARFLPLSYRWYGGGGENDSHFLGTRGEVAAYVSNRLRVGLGFPLSDWPLPDRENLERVSISVAYANASGLVYWFYRLLR